MSSNKRQRTLQAQGACWLNGRRTARKSFKSHLKLCRPQIHETDCRPLPAKSLTFHPQHLRARTKSCSRRGRRWVVGQMQSGTGPGLYNCSWQVPPVPSIPSKSLRFRRMFCGRRFHQAGRDIPAARHATGSRYCPKYNGGERLLLPEAISGIHGTILMVATN